MPAHAPPGGRGAVDRTFAALSRLAPGDVLVLDGTKVAVLSVAFRKGNPRLHVVDERSKPRSIGADELSEPPHAVGTVELPEPYNPNNRSFQHQVGEALRRARTSRHGVPVDEGPEVDDGVRRGRGPPRGRLPGS